MPLASLSTFAVMKPGPTTAKNSTIWIFQRLRNRMRAVHDSKLPNRPFRINGGGFSEQVKSGREAKKKSELAAQHIDDVVGRNYAFEVISFVDHGQGQQIVLIEEFGELFLLRVFMGGNQRLLDQAHHRSPHGRENDLRQRHRARQSPLG